MLHRHLSTVAGNGKPGTSEGFCVFKCSLWLPEMHQLENEVQEE